MRTAMASTKLASILFCICSVFVQRLSADVICEKLPTKVCSFAVSSGGKRCVLENYSADNGSVGYTCKTSDITVDRLYGLIESDQCVSACGVDRGSVGISSDPFLSKEFAAHLCSAACYHNCPNIVDLYFNLAAGEGVSLPAFCAQLRRSGGAVLSILSNSDYAAAPMSSPMAMAPSPAYL